MGVRVDHHAPGLARTTAVRSCRPLQCQKRLGGAPALGKTEGIPGTSTSRACRLSGAIPLLAGSGTRLKILEAWSAGLPVVSTPLGAEGLPVKNGEHLLLAANGPDFASAVLRLLACPSLREKLGTAGRVLLEKEFTWDTVWKSLDL